MEASKRSSPLFKIELYNCFHVVIPLIILYIKVLRLRYQKINSLRDIELTSCLKTEETISNRRSLIGDELLYAEIMTKILHE